jgi:hypothetical protein
VFTDQAVPEHLAARITRVGWRAFGTWATPGVGLPLSPDVLLVPTGLLLLAWRSERDLRRRVAGPALLFLCWTAATYAIVTVNLGFDSSHYFAPLVSVNMALGGLALATAGRGLWKLARGTPADREKRPLVDPGAEQVQG